MLRTTTRLARTALLAVSCLALTSPRCPAQDLAVHLSFDGDTLDSSGNAYDGTLTEGILGGSEYVEGPVGQALRLLHDPDTLESDMIDGASVGVPYTLTEAGTIALWYRVSPWYNYQSVWDNSGDANDHELWIYTDGRLRGRIDDSVGQVTHQLDVFNAWIHIAYTWERGGEARLFVDGVERDLESGVRAVSAEGFDGATLGDTFFLGGGNVGNTFSNGAFDDLRIYDGAIDEAAVLALFEAGDPPDDPTEPPAELLAHFEFEGNEDDSSGNGYDGEIFVGPLGDFSYAEGPVGDALELLHDPATLTSDQTEGAYVEIPLRLPEAGSIALWYRVTDLYNYQTIFDNIADPDDWELWIYQDGVIRGRVDGGVGQVSHTLATINRWVHIAYTWKRGDQARLYIDGEETDTASGLRAISDDAFDAALLGDFFYLGGGNPGNRFGIGAWDDVRIYEGRLTADEVRALFEAGDPPEIDPGTGKDPELLIHWDFEEDFSDGSGNGNDGELVEGALGGHGWIDGPVGRALDLDHDPGTVASDSIDGSYVQVAYPITESGSILLWYYAEPFYNYQTIWDNSGHENHWEMWIYDTGVLRGRADGNVGQVSHQLAGAERWYHIAYTWHRGDRARLWIDGVERDTESAARTLSNVGFDASIRGDLFFLGGGNPGNRFANGAFDDFRMYDGVLSEEEILEIMAEGDPPDGPPVGEPEDPGEPVVHWPLDGDLVNDGVFGDLYDGVLVEGPAGDVSFVEARIGDGLSLDHGADPGATGGSWVQVPNPLGEEGTIALWYYARDWYNYQTIFDNSIQQDDWEMWIYADGILRARVDGGSGVVSYDLDLLDGPNQWYHIAYSWDLGEARAELFVNGQRVSTSVVTNWIEPGELFFLGGGNDGNDYGNGVWDDVRIYDHALTPEEVLFVKEISSTCPTEGDTHCDELLVEPPEGGGPGVYQLVSFASDDSGDSIRYTFRAESDGGVVREVGPQDGNLAEIELFVGTWTLSVTVDDEASCDDVADDASCSTDIVVSEGVGPVFHRGDSDDDGSIQLTDAIVVLNWLFLGGPEPGCLDAADADDSESIALTDAVVILNWLFLGGPAPAPPGPPSDGPCGPDPSGVDDGLGCAVYESCE